MIKLSVPAGKECDNLQIFSLRKPLVPNIVNARHILPGKPSEIMPKAAPGAGMLIVVLYEMPDI